MHKDTPLTFDEVIEPLVKDDLRTVFSVTENSGNVVLYASPAAALKLELFGVEHSWQANPPVSTQYADHPVLLDSGTLVKAAGSMAKLRQLLEGIEYIGGDRDQQLTRPQLPLAKARAHTSSVVAAAGEAPPVPATEQEKAVLDKLIAEGDLQIAVHRSAHADRRYTRALLSGVFVTPQGKRELDKIGITSRPLTASTMTRFESDAISEEGMVGHVQTSNRDKPSIGSIERKFGPDIKKYIAEHAQHIAPKERVAEID